MKTAVQKVSDFPAVMPLPLQNLFVHHLLSQDFLLFTYYYCSQYKTYIPFLLLPLGWISPLIISLITDSALQQNMAGEGEKGSRGLTKTKVP